MTQSALAANQDDAEVKDNITSLISSRDEMKQQVTSLQAKVQNLAGVIKLLSDNVKKGEDEEEEEARRTQSSISMLQDQSLQ